MKSKIITILALCLLPLFAHAQSAPRDTAVTVDYSRTPRECVIGGIQVEGVKNFDQRLLVGLSGLSVGQTVKIPGEDITKAIRRFWRNGLFANVSVKVDSIVHSTDGAAPDSAYLHILLTQRPRISQITYHGVKKSEREDLEEKLGLVKENQLTPNMLDRAKILARRYFDEKGYKNAELIIKQHDDVSQPDKIALDVYVDKKSKVKIHRIYLFGNNNLPDRTIKGGLLRKGVLKKIREKKGWRNWFRSHKFVESKYKEAKENLEKKYAELGYRDAVIVADSVVPAPNKDNMVDVYIHVEEGQKYYVRNIDWVGNTVYPTDLLQALLRLEKGDVYNQTHIEKRTLTDEDAIGNLYYNNGYVFYHLTPVEINIVGDSVDLEMRIVEGQQAHLSRVKITGNERVYENVIRRELRTKPGDLFSKEALERSYREIASMGHFDPEHIEYKVEPDIVNGTVDMGWGVTPKSNDQVEFSLGYGQTGVIGKIGLKFGNFCLANLFKKGGLRRGVMPNGNGETFSISGQTNCTYYQSYSISYTNPWFGGKRPNSLSFSAFYSRQTDVSDSYYNSAYYNNYYSSYLYGMGTSGYNYYENYYDPDKYVQMFGVTLGWGKRLRWPDDYFYFQAVLGYTRYMLKDWSYFIIQNGSCNNLNLTLSLSRNSTDNQIYPRRGSTFSVEVSFTPPYSLFNNKDYSKLGTNPNSATYQQELQDKYRWIEYHKWKFKSRTYTALSSANKCFVLMTRVDMGILGSYKDGVKSPFETFYVGGDGTSGYSSTYATETIALRGYDNGSLTPSRNTLGYAYNRFSLELRYPFMLGASTNIYGLVFVEGGNAWTEIKRFNPFDLKKSAGVGARIFLPMVGLLGIDWAYGFDEVFGSKIYSGSHFHFILGQEF